MAALTRFSNRIIAITGAYGGFGREIVQKVKDEGGKIIAIGRNESELKNLQNQQGGGSSNCEIVCADLMTESGQKDIIDAMIQYNADSLVNNAGIFRENLCTDFDRREYDDAIAS